MPATCDKCGKEVGYEDVIVQTCDLGYEHTKCKKCVRREKNANNKKNI